MSSSFVEKKEHPHTIMKMFVWASTWMSNSQVMWVLMGCLNGCGLRLNVVDWLTKSKLKKPSWILWLTEPNRSFDFNLLQSIAHQSITILKPVSLSPHLHWSITKHHLKHHYLRKRFIFIFLMQTETHHRSSLQLHPSH